MTNKTYSDTNFTVQVKSLLSRTYGRSQLKDSVLDRAIEYYEKALEISLKILGPKHPSIATSWNNLGICYIEKGKYKLVIHIVN